VENNLGKVGAASSTPIARSNFFKGSRRLLLRRRPAALTRRRLKRGEFRSIVVLQAAINSYISMHNDGPKLRWSHIVGQLGGLVKVYSGV